MATTPRAAHDVGPDVLVRRPAVDAVDAPGGAAAVLTLNLVGVEVVPRRHLHRGTEKALRAGEVNPRAHRASGQGTVELGDHLRLRGQDTQPGQPAGAEWLTPVVAG